MLILSSTLNNSIALSGSTSTVEEANGTLDEVCWFYIVEGRPVQGPHILLNHCHVCITLRARVILSTMMRIEPLVATSANKRSASFYDRRIQSLVVTFTRSPLLGDKGLSKCHDCLTMTWQMYERPLRNLSCLPKNDEGATCCACDSVICSCVAPATPQYLLNLTI